MTSCGTFRKVSTEWLDINDRKPGEGNPIENPEVCSFVAREHTTDLVTIPVAGSSESSTESGGQQETSSASLRLSPQDRFFPFLKYFSHRASMKETTGHDEGCKPGSAHCAESRIWFAKMTHEQIGTGQYIGIFALLSCRIIFFFILAISGGLVFGHRHEVDFVVLHSELFVWLHYWFFVLYPLMLWSSVLTLRTLNPEAVDPGLIWTFTSALFHILATFAQVELFRLLLLHYVPQLQPSDISRTTIYSLSSSFAAQRYIMFIATLVEFYFSTIPFLIEHVIVIVIISGIWETASIFIKDIRPLWISIVLSIVIFSLATIQALINLLIANRLRGHSTKNSGLH